MNKEVEKELEDVPPYITIEISNTKHMVAHKIIGNKDQFRLVCHCTSHAQAKRLIDKLNKN